MRKNSHRIFYRFLKPVLLVQVLSACTGVNESDMNEEEEIPVYLAMNVSSERADGYSTRMSAIMTQQTGNYRKIQDLHLIPYSVRGTIHAEDNPLIGRVDELSFVESTEYHYFGQRKMVPTGTASFLCYCRAVPVDDKFANGSIQTTAFDNNRIATNQIKFLPEQIYTGDPGQDALDIADYMTSIAKAGNWHLSDNEKLKILFHNFVNEGNVIAGSSANVSKLVDKLKASVSNLAFADESDEKVIQQAILDAIEARSVANGYPASIQLPDGAAVLQWNGNLAAFESRTQTTTTAPITSQNRFVYPAELFYYANSQINTSFKDNIYTITEADYNTSWDRVLDLYENKQDVVSAHTKAAAIIEPLRYGVGCLQATVHANSETLRDADMEEITVGDETFPLTGVLISGQYAQGFNLEPYPNELNEYIAYDKAIEDIYLKHYSDTESVPPFYTLVFQSKERTATENQSIQIALEFKNNSDKDFKGLNGIVYRDTHFYLIGSLTAPNDDPSKDYTKRVFTQNYLTIASMKVENLAKAYNIVPDLTTARLEMGVQITPQWIQATPTNVPLQ